MTIHQIEVGQRIVTRVTKPIDFFYVARQYFFDCIFWPLTWFFPLSIPIQIFPVLKTRGHVDKKLQISFIVLI